ncbi:MAG: hypothetical protein M3440_10975, partial [Chloroflexota bacterium]|nr:hypothetical protein [Chloroflexota bacterium]
MPQPLRNGTIDRRSLLAATGTAGLSAALWRSADAQEAPSGSTALVSTLSDTSYTVHFVGDMHVGYKDTMTGRFDTMLPDLVTLNDEIDHRVYVGDLVHTADNATELAWAKSYLSEAGPTSKYD